MKCHEVITNKYTTIGQPSKEWKCYCGTTACLQNTIQNYNSVETITTFKKDKNCDCKYEKVLIDGLCQKCESKYYKKVLKSKLL